MGKYNWENLKSNLQKGVGEKYQNDFDDPREWKLQRDENDNGTAVIRLLPGKGGDTPAVVRIFEHSVRVFHKPSNKWRYYIETSPSSIKEPCPVSDVWYELADIGTDEAKKFQKTFSRSVKFISNILVVNDPASPENNGKIFYWKYGVKLFEKFEKALKPTETQIAVGKKPIELFDPEDGADITLSVTRVGEFINYDGTTIEAPSKAFENEEDMDEAVLEKCYDLSEFISQEYYSKSYTELKNKLAKTLEKSAEEAYLVSHNSQVISDFYTRNSGQTEEAQSGSSTPNVGGSYTPKTKKPTPEVSDDPQLEVGTESEVPEPVKAKKKAEVKAKVKKTVQAETESNESILEMLDEL